MRIGVLGAGAIGTLFGTRLHLAGHDVVLYNHNSAMVRAVKRDGILFKEFKRRSRTIRVPIKLPPGKLDDDLILVTVKAYDTPEVARKYRGKVSPTTEVLTLQNGLGNYESLSGQLGREKVFVGSTTEAALSRPPRVLMHTGLGTTWLGEMERGNGDSERVRRITRVFRGAGFRTTPTNAIRSVLWKKAVVNSAINPVSALTKLRNGQLNRDPNIRWLMRELIKEGVSVAAYFGLKLNVEELSRFLSQVLLSTSANKSSMLRDIELRRQTEIRQLNGIIVESGRKHGFDPEMNQIVLSLVEGLERSLGVDVSKHQ